MARPSTFTKEDLLLALANNENNPTRAAAELGKSASTVHRAMGRWGIHIAMKRAVEPVARKEA